MSPTRIGCRICQRPVPLDSPCGCCCWNCDDAPPSGRRWFRNTGALIAGVLAAVLLIAAVSFLAVQFDQRYDVQPSPDGPVVVEVQP